MAKNEYDFDRCALLIPCPNHTHQTGLHRNSMIVNPALLPPDFVASSSRSPWRWRSVGERMEQFFRFGQLLGIMVRTKGLLTIDLHELFWRQLTAGGVAIATTTTKSRGQRTAEQADVVHLSHEEQQRVFYSFDFTAWSNLRFKDPSSGEDFSEEQFEQYYSSLRLETTASHSLRQIRLPGYSRNARVSYAERHDYARVAMQARLTESGPQMHAVLRGLHTIVPKRTLRLFRWHELEMWVCGNSTLDLRALKKQTVYSPAKFTAKSKVVRNFWRVLESFSEEEKSKYLQFSWARSRLPPVYDAEDKSWRMKVNILESGTKTDRMLPTAETCFFNVNLPSYSSYQLMREKLLMAITHCSSITS